MDDIKLRHNRIMNKIVDKLYGQLLEDDIVENMDFRWDRFIPEDMVNKMKEYMKARRGSRYRWILLTVNVKEGTDLHLLMKKSEKCSKKIWIKHAEWCYEWREVCTGLHMHMAIEVDDEVKKKPSEMRRECYNTFKHLIGNPQHVNMKFSNQCCFNSYIRGIKNGEWKENRENDIRLRLEYGLEATYSKGGGPTS